MADLLSGRKTVTTAGTAVQMGSSQQVEFIVVQALSGNTNAVEIGDSSVVAATATQRGLRLTASQVSQPLQVDDIGDIWVDAITSGEGVAFLGITGP